MRFQTCEFLIRVKENSETPGQIAVKTRRKGTGYKSLGRCFSWRPSERKVWNEVK